MLRHAVILFFIATPVTSLKCYMCSSSATNAECNKSYGTCQPPLDTCMTMVDTLGYMKAIVKQCASSSICSGAAAAASVDADGNGNRVTCCDLDMCNLSGAESVRSHQTLLLLGLGGVFLLLMS